MYQPKYTPIASRQAQPTSQDQLPECFTLLAWNLQKTDFSHYVYRNLKELLTQSELTNEPHILSFQEAKTLPEQISFFNLSFVIAPNIQTKKNHFGVLTASSSIINPIRQCLTQSRELGWATHKTALITQHKLSNNQILTHVNIHAINFVSHSVFHRELQKLFQYLDQITGPIIISGDFNTWNKKRTKTLIEATQKLSLKMVKYPDHRPIKSIFKQPLDHIFYRQLTLQSSQAIDVNLISDHNPILATFCTINNH